jgi:predicted transcriptional regulator of viral defense system
VEAAGLSRTALGRLVEVGAIERVRRGLYAPANAKVTQHHTLVEAAKRVPLGVVCLLSALRFHGLATQNPHEVWIAVDVKARKPAADWPPLHVVRFSGEALTYGIEPHIIEGVDVRVTSREKTVADCFKYRNKIGLDVALEALRGYLWAPCSSEPGYPNCTAPRKTSTRWAAGLRISIVWPESSGTFAASRWTTTA